jgi:cytochrome c oxidase subunit 2
VAWLTWGVLAISLAVTVIIALLLTAAIWRGRNAALQSLDGAQALARPVGGLNWIWIGVGLTSLVLLFSIVWTLWVLARVSAPPVKPAVTIEITGRQWWWQVRYLSDDPARVFTTANEIHIPTGVPVRFKLISGDVIHSFWVPALAGKTDVIPGQTNELWLDASKPGVYRGQCGEYCGVEHARMGFLVIAQTPAAFRAWWDHQLQPILPPVNGQSSAGAADFNAHCGSCHAVRGSDAAGVLGPDLSHFMTRRTIAAAMLANNRANLARWIRDPQGIKPGNMMQAPEISSAELSGILSYLQTLN